MEADTSTHGSTPESIISHQHVEYGTVIKVDDDTGSLTDKLPSEEENRSLGSAAATIVVAGQHSDAPDDLLMPTFSQVPWHTLIQRMDNGSQGLLELSILFHDKKDNDEKALAHYVRISRSSLYEHEIEASTSERMLGFFKNYHLFLYKVFLQQHKVYIETLVQELEDAKLQRAVVINKHKVGIQTCLNNITHAQEAVLKAKKHHCKTKIDFERTAERLEIAEKAAEDYAKLLEEKKKDTSNKDNNKWSRMFSAFESTPDQERDKLQKKYSKRHEEMISAANTILERRRQLLALLSHYDEQIQQVNRIDHHSLKK
jgi:hypothetical protein